VDFRPDEDQQAILEAVDQLLERAAGPERAIRLQAKNGYDEELDAELEQAGFADIALAEGGGILEAALVAFAAARAAAVSSVTARTLVLPGALGEAGAAAPIAIAEAPATRPVRFLAHARTLVVLDAAELRLLALEPGDAEPVPSNFGYPVGRLTEQGRGRLAGCRAHDSGERALRRLECFWRVGLAIEAAGTMAAALDQTVAYLKERRQFGRAIGSFQAVQHRLAECAIQVEASRWLALEAADLGAPAEAAATAAAYALDAAGHVFAETHQLSGAIGYTREHDLHVWSMRLRALRLELGGVSGHQLAVARARWKLAP